MEDVLWNPRYEFLQPLVNGWLAKLESAERSRRAWRELADECMMYYSKSAAAMWDPDYTRKFWKNIKPPKFRISINKAFEFVAVMGPNLLWSVPHRNVEPKRALFFSQDLIPQDEMLQAMLQQMMPLQQNWESRDKLVAHLMSLWLNYTPGELPGGGLSGQSWLSLIDALIKGRGVMAIRPYQMPGSGRTLTGCFRIPPEDLLIDPDFKTLEDARWISIKHIDPHWAVEERFKLPKNSLKNRATLESIWHFSELSTSDQINGSHRKEGQTNDLVVWYEIYSKTGCGSSCIGMEDPLREQLEKTVGRYAYLAITPSCPYPLNCSSELIRYGGPGGQGATSEQVKQKFQWPMPLWADDRWPVECLDFYKDPDSAWPVPPMAPAMGELKFLNFMVPWLANRIYTSSRDFWAVAGAQIEQYRKYLVEGEDQTLIPVMGGTDDVRKAIAVLQQPETRLDVWRIVELVSELFDKRTGLTESIYGRNENGTQNRTAEETLAKQRAVGARPEFMQNQVVAWQSEMAAVEAYVARFFVTGQDVQPLMGPVGRLLWEQFIMSTDVELVVRQMEYKIAASSIRRPNRDRDVANFQQAMGLFLPVIQQYGTQFGDYSAMNGLMQKWGELHDMNMESAMLQPPPPPQPDPAQEMEMQMAQLELQGKQMDMQAKQMDTQGKLQLAQADMQNKMQLAGLQQQTVEQKLQAESAKNRLGLIFDAAQFQQELAQDQQMHEQEMRQKTAEFQIDAATQRAQTSLKLQETQEMSKAKVAAARAQAKAKPKTPSKGSKT